MAYATRLSEKSRPAAFIKSDLGMRSYERAKIEATEEFEPGTPVSVLTATGNLARYDNAGNDGTEVLFGFLVDRVLPGFQGEFEVVAVLARDAEVWTDRIPFPRGADDAATAALRAALIAEAVALGILPRA